MMPATCRDCRYWKPGPTEKLAGECRRNPPVALMFSDGPETHFPTANADDWCGEISIPARCAATYRDGDATLPCGKLAGHTSPCGPRAA